MVITFARSATKHRVSRRDSEHVLRMAAGWFEVPPPVESGRTAMRRVYVGVDLGGRPLEVFAVELPDDSLLVIHAMRLRHSTAKRIERMRWQSD